MLWKWISIVAFVPALVPLVTAAHNYEPGMGAGAAAVVNTAAHNSSAQQEPTPLSHEVRETGVIQWGPLNYTRLADLVNAKSSSITGVFHSPPKFGGEAAFQEAAAYLRPFMTAAAPDATTVSDTTTGGEHSAGTIGDNTKLAFYDIRRDCSFPAGCSEKCLVECVPPGVAVFVPLFEKCVKQHPIHNIVDYIKVW